MATIAEAFGTRWLPVRDGDARAYALYRRHYSQKPGLHHTRKFTGPGEYLLLLTPDAAATFLWRVERFRRDGQKGVNCAIFRNEGTERSSNLIREACAIAWERWPGQRLFSFVNAEKVASPNPGYCFLMAGWRRCGMSKGGLLILEILPEQRLPLGA